MTRERAPADLERERRLRALDLRIGEALGSVEPARAELLASELSEERMANDKPTSVWLNADIKRRIAALSKRMGAQSDLAALLGTGSVSQSAVLRLAILRGLEALEAEHGARKPTKRGNRTYPQPRRAL